MSKVPALKKKAADLEKKSPEKAIPVYVELLAEMEKEPGELDVALFNRVGDLMAKAGNVAEAVDYYEKAVDHYTEGGFFNNAIALCSKILRSSPGRATVYYKLGKISAQKGFKADAKKNFLEYADRMQKAGKVDEAFRALGEFADLVPEETDVRLMLSDQMLKAGKEKEAIEHLQVLHEQFDRDGNTSEAQATAERLRAIDPSIEPRAAGQSGDGGGGGGGSKTDDLVFLDLSDTPAAQNQRLSVAKRVTSQLKPVTEPAKKTPPATPVVPPPAVKAPSPPPVMDKAPPPAVEAEAPADGGLLEIESTSLSSGDNTSAVSGGLEIESTSMAEPEAPASDGGALDLIMPDADEPAVTASADIPLMDLGEPEADTSAEPVADIPLIDADLEIATPEPRPSTIIAKKSVAVLTAAVEASPDDWAAHR